MKHLVVFILLCSCSSTLFAQQKTTPNYNYLKSVKMDIVVDDLLQTKSRIDTFFRQISVSPSSYTMTNMTFRVEIHTDSLKHLLILEQVRKYGFVSKEVSTSHYRPYELQSAIDELTILKKEKELYEDFLARLDSSEQTKRFEFWDKFITLSKTISEKENELKRLETVHKFYYIQILFEKEKVIGQSYSDSWINMPGFEFSYLKTEQPNKNVTPDYMIGYSLKYMMNYKKTYALLSLYKSPVAETKVSVNELYMVGFGQDFYSKRLGRGQRKFFNLYTSFNTGVYIASSELTKNVSWFVNPFIGLEIFKTKNIILDNKLGYFLPYKDNRYQRGALYSLSFNFVF